MLNDRIKNSKKNKKKQAKKKAKKRKALNSPKSESSRECVGLI
jgi:hypothetical protein